MNKQKPDGTNLESLLDMLAGTDGPARLKARRSLVALGKPAVFPLVQVLQNSKSGQVRWEAAKTLGAIDDTSAIAPLVKALEDSDPDVAWLAAKGLRKFKKAAWAPLLHVLIDSGSKSDLVRQRAHFVLGKQKEDGFNDLLASLLKTLESGAVPESVPMAAYKILELMESKS